jgi:preprotein translocase subunit SecG
VDSIFGLALIVVSVGLMASILLQARGAGLSATFGGDSSVYRSRRGVEKRLYQFTVVLATLWALVALINFLVTETRLAPTT